MTTNLKGRTAHLSVVPPVPTFEPFYDESTPAWWQCPPWCTDCSGGGSWIASPDLPGVKDCRMHERQVYATQAVDDLDRGWTEVEVRIERADADADETPVAADVVLRFAGEDKSQGWFGVRLTRTQRRELAAALLNADDLDDTTGAAA